MLNLIISYYIFFQFFTELHEKHNILICSLHLAIMLKYGMLKIDATRHRFDAIQNDFRNLLNYKHLNQRRHVFVLYEFIFYSLFYELLLL